MSHLTRSLSAPEYLASSSRTRFWSGPWNSRPIRSIMRCSIELEDRPCLLDFSQHRDGLTKITQGFHGGPIFPPNLFGNRDMTFVAVDKGVDGGAAMTCHAAMASRSRN